MIYFTIQLSIGDGSGMNRGRTCLERYEMADEKDIVLGVCANQVAMVRR